MNILLYPSLKDSAWQSLRRLVLNRDRLCSHCQQTASRAVTLLGAYTLGAPLVPENLRGVCGQACAAQLAKTTWQLQPVHEQVAREKVFDQVAAILHREMPRVLARDPLCTSCKRHQSVTIVSDAKARSPDFASRLRGVCMPCKRMLRDKRR